MSLFAKILTGSRNSSFSATTEKDPGPKVAFIKGQAVGDSRDLRRVLALPKRDRPDDATLALWAKEYEARLGTHVASCTCVEEFRRPCCRHLLPVQAWALHEAEAVGGILGPIGVGWGKTLLDLLTPMVVPCNTAVLLIPPNLKRQLTEVDWRFYGRHWRLPNLAGGRWFVPGLPTLHVVAFSELSGSRATDLLHRLRPDVVVVDEAHSVRNRTAARTKRFLRYFTETPATRLFAWSGTLTSRSLRDYAHLSALSLREASPAPLLWPTVEEWASHLDPGDFRSPPGRLLDFGVADAREGFRERLVRTRGVISSGEASACQASLTFSERKVVVPEKVALDIAAVEASWQRPDGEELVDAMSVARCQRELSCGFFYRWRWPRKEPLPVIERWLAARKEWHKELREKLKRGGPHMDSPLLLAKAAIRWFNGYVHIERDQDGKEVNRKEIPAGTQHGPLPTWASATWQEWERVRDTAKPETEPVWTSDFLVRDAVEWLREGPGLLWYEFDAFGRAAARAAGREVVFAGPGSEGDARVITLRGSEAVVASIRAHGTGKNLQQFSRNLVANPPSDGATWEQLVGRTHRQGQLADEVTVDVYRHTAPFVAAVDRARDLAAYIQGTFGASQKLVSRATFTF